MGRPGPVYWTSLCMMMMVIILAGLRSCVQAQGALKGEFCTHYSNCSYNLACDNNTCDCLYGFMFNSSSNMCQIIPLPSCNLTASKVPTSWENGSLVELELQCENKGLDSLGIEGWRDSDIFNVTFFKESSTLYRVFVVVINYTPGQYNFSIFSTLGGYSSASSILLQMFNPPQFLDSELYSTTIQDISPSGSTLFSFSAVDVDDASSSQTYQLKNNDSQLPFHISSNGLLFLDTLPQPLTRVSYLIVVEAKSPRSGLTASATGTVVVRVTNTSRNPICDQPENLAVNLGLTPQSRIVTVTCFGPDSSPQFQNGSYSIATDPSIVQLNWSNSGEIILLETLPSNLTLFRVQLTALFPDIVMVVGFNVVIIGQKCSSYLDCQNNVSCVNLVCGCQPNERYMGTTCRPVGYPGINCSQDNQCNTNLTCINSTCNCKPNEDFILGSCLPAGFPGRSCARTAQCNPSLSCLNNSCGCQLYQVYDNRTCQSVGFPGINCNSSLQCNPTVSCLGNTCSCQPSQYYSGTTCYPKGFSGSMCVTDFQCNPTMSCIYGRCGCQTNQQDLSGYCQQKNFVYTCYNDDQCNPTLSCLNRRCRCKDYEQLTDGYCQPVGFLDHGCTIDSQCNPSLSCINNNCSCQTYEKYIENYCLAVGFPGAACLSTAVCNPSLSCINNVCSCQDGELYRDGYCWRIGFSSACSGDTQCGSSLSCINDVCACAPYEVYFYGFCLPLSSRGSYCVSSIQCPDTFTCLNNTCLCSPNNTFFNGSHCVQIFGKACASTAECTPTLTCSYQQCTCLAGEYDNGTHCLPLQWKRCNYSRDCDSRYYGYYGSRLSCINNTCGCYPDEVFSLGYCNQVGARGMNCSSSADCSANLSCVNNTCDCLVTQFYNGSVCQPRLNYNQTCSYGYYGQCRDGLQCLGGRCSCQSWEYLMDWGVYNSTSCLPKKFFGDYCADSQQCSDTLDCFNNSCQCRNGSLYNGTTCFQIQKFPVGYPCSMDYQCSATAVCRNSVCSCPEEQFFNLWNYQCEDTTSQSCSNRFEQQFLFPASLTEMIISTNCSVQAGVGSSSHCYMTLNWTPMRSQCTWASINVTSEPEESYTWSQLMEQVPNSLYDPADLDVSGAVHVLDTLWKLHKLGNLSTNEDTLEKYATVIDQLLSRSQESWQDREDEFSLLLTIMEEVALDSLHNLTNNMSVIERNNLLIVRGQTKEDIVFASNMNLEGYDTQYQDWVQNTSTTAFLSREAFSMYESVGYSFILYSNVSRKYRLKDQTQEKFESGRLLRRKVFNSQVLSFSLDVVLYHVNPPLRVSFTGEEVNYRDPVCAFLDSSISEDGLWSSDGCAVTEIGSNKVICSCNHLTNFALLMSPYNNEDERILSIISVVGCALSIFCMVLTLAAFKLVWRVVKSDANVCRANLCVCLIAAYICFMAGVDRTEDKAGCTVVSGLLHYLFLTVFFLMLCDGILVYKMTFFVYHRDSIINKLLIFTYGAPLVIVAISLGATRTKGYGPDDSTPTSTGHCWLSVTEHVLWAFVGPVLLILLINLLISLRVLIKVFKTKEKSKRSACEKIWSVIRNISVLSSTMGLTWLFGVLSVNSDLLVFQYFFAIFNTLQGVFIFIFTVLLAPNVSAALRKKFRILQDQFSLSKTYRSNGSDQRL